MTVFQWLAGGFMLLLVVLELVLQFSGGTRRSISTLRLIVWSLAAFFIINPDATLPVARLLSIGRGTDLLLYLTVIGFMISFFYVIHALEKHREQITSLVRQIAMNSPYSTPSSEGSNDDPSNSQDF